MELELTAAIIFSMIGLLAALIARQHQRVNNKDGVLASIVSISFFSFAALLVFNPMVRATLFIFGLSVAIGTGISSLIVHVPLKNK